MPEATATYCKSQRILNGRQFGQILRKGTGAADGVLVLVALASKRHQPPRLGVTIPKKVGNAVIRNRWKRLIRESFRTQQHQLPVGFDFVVRPKKGAQPSWAEIQKSIPKLARRATSRERMING